MKVCNIISEEVNPNIEKKSSEKFSTCHQVFIRKENSGQDKKEQSICSCWTNQIVSGDVSLKISTGKRVCAHCPEYCKRESAVLIENVKL